MADTFQPDFYVTCATVIPVLFLALAVQGRAFESVLSASQQADTYAERRRLRRERRGPESATERAKLWHRTVEALAPQAGFAIYIFALFLLFTGVFGEGFALYVLYRGSPLGSVRGFLFVATVILAATVAAGPFLAFMRSSDDQHREAETGAKGSPSDPAA